MCDKSKTFQEGRQFDRRNFLKVPIAAAVVGLLGWEFGWQLGIRRSADEGTT